jgi:hypothetical protein
LMDKRLFLPTSMGLSADMPSAWPVHPKLQARLKPKLVGTRQSTRLQGERGNAA